MDCLTLKMEAQRSFETLVTIYQSIRGNILEDFNLKQPRYEDLKHCDVYPCLKTVKWYQKLKTKTHLTTIIKL